jgi:hypothetical protein
MPQPWLRPPPLSCTEQETLVTVMATARKTLDEARTHERATALAWEKENTITHHLEHQFATAQGIALP